MDVPRGTRYSLHQLDEWSSPATANGRHGRWRDCGVAVPITLRGSPLKHDHTLANLVGAIPAATVGAGGSNSDAEKRGQAPSASGGSTWNMDLRHHEPVPRDKEP
jgi:hypothetical protein